MAQLCEEFFRPFLRNPFLSRSETEMQRQTGSIQSEPSTSVQPDLSYEYMTSLSLSERRISNHAG